MGHGSALAQLLLLVGNRKPILNEPDTRPDEHSFEFGHVVKELLDLVGGCEPHYTFNASAVVPRAVEEHDFATSRQIATYRSKYH